MNPTAWRTPTVILIALGVALTVALGARQTFGLYLHPMTAELGWPRQTFAFALALQALVYGLSQPFTGMIADKYGAGRVMLGGAVLYTVGLVLMSGAKTGLAFDIAAGVLIGIALSCVSYSIAYGAIGRAFPAERRSTALGIAGACGSFGQFIMLPVVQALLAGPGWKASLLVLAATVAIIVPVAAFVAGNHIPPAQDRQSIPDALREAFGHKGYVMLCLGYTVCGLQITFMMVHFPAFLVDQKLGAETGMWALALIGLFNIIGSYAWGRLGSMYRKKYLLAALYFIRSAAIAAFIFTPITPISVYLFASVIGFLWLGTAPLTSGMIAQIFGVKYLSTLGGISFLFHQVGSFVGVSLGGWLYDNLGSYQIMWTINIGMGIVAALLNWPIDDRPVQRAAPAPA